MSTLNALAAFRAVEDPIRRLPTADLKAELETARWLALEFAPGDESREFAELRIADMARELDRRAGLRRRHAGDPLTPPWPADEPGLRDRVIRIKQDWPLVEACRQLLGVIPDPCGSGRHRCSCPLGTHEDRTPSFVLYPDGHAHCFGCRWTGDVISLVGEVYGIERFSEKLSFLEGVTGRGVA